MTEPLYKVKAEFFKTLGHPARIRILELLVTGDKSVAELCPRWGWRPRISPSSWVCSAGQVWSTRTGTATR